MRVSLRGSERVASRIELHISFDRMAVHHMAKHCIT